ncbi:hypothetical protein KIN20_017468 [Parelaphostrongylus tenuis]|uniref:Uncharacterized protein n=1 Tax=Parelaphostrongylus tenuis TaxID=148309 RepID=A0AAD5QQT2_PARTN|nr:hypothetical protein KIN20_017468 [Parelaphostrongylus tenuis]
MSPHYQSCGPRNNDYSVDSPINEYSQVNRNAGIGSSNNEQSSEQGNVETSPDKNPPNEARSLEEENFVRSLKKVWRLAILAHYHHRHPSTQSSSDAVVN